MKRVLAGLALLVGLLALLILVARAAGAEVAATPGAPGRGRRPKAAAPPADPYAANACVQCHRDLPGRSSEIVDQEWQYSVHFNAGVGCDGCHGGNAAVRREQYDSDDAFKQGSHLDRNPEFLLLPAGKEFVSAARGRSVSYFCGKCHAKIKEQHLGSPHGEFGDPTCLFCHGQGRARISQGQPRHHRHAQPEPGRGRCSPCHRSATMEAVGRIQAILIDTEKQIKVSGKLMPSWNDGAIATWSSKSCTIMPAETRSQFARYSTASTCATSTTSPAKSRRPWADHRRLDLAGEVVDVAHVEAVEDLAQAASALRRVVVQLLELQVAVAPAFQLLVELARAVIWFSVSCRIVLIRPTACMVAAAVARAAPAAHGSAVGVDDGGGGL